MRIVWRGVVSGIEAVLVECQHPNVEASRKLACPLCGVRRGRGLPMGAVRLYLRADDARVRALEAT